MLGNQMEEQGFERLGGTERLLLFKKIFLFVFNLTGSKHGY